MLLRFPRLTVGSLVTSIACLTVWAETGVAEPPAGFVPLFNGQDLSGWRGLAADPKQRAGMTEEELAAAQQEADERAQAHWHVRDGVLEGDGTGGNLCTAKDYGDFEMLVDWKILPQGDSGIYPARCAQVQIWDTTYEPLWKYGADKGSGALWNNEHHARFPLVNADNPIGEWNTFYIKMVGERVTVKLNGQLVVDDVLMENYWDPTKPIAPKGTIELQSHGNKLWFRNLYIHQLPKQLDGKSR